jgi:hypothetical protein
MAYGFEENSCFRLCKKSIRMWFVSDFFSIYESNRAGSAISWSINVRLHRLSACRDPLLFDLVVLIPLPCFECAPCLSSWVYTNINIVYLHSLSFITKPSNIPTRCTLIMAFFH